MKQFKKQILTEGIYFTGDGKGGRKLEFIPKERIEHWATQHSEMKKAGLDVTAPAMHTSLAIPESKDDDKRWSASEEGSKANYGFWEKMEVGETVDEEGNHLKTLNGVLDVPREEDADKVGKTVKATSIYAVPEFVDGSGKLWEDVITHVYVGNDTIEAGQKNFIEVSDPSHLAVAMSHRLPIQMDSSQINAIINDDDGDISNTDNVYTLLEKVAGVCIPQGTTPDDLERALVAALKQKQLSENNREGGTVDKPPKKADVHEVPVTMSQNQKKSGTEQVPNETPKAETVSMSQFNEVQSQNNGLLATLTNEKKSQLSNRLNVLAERRILDEAELKTYQEQINSITSMSFDSKNQPVKTSAEVAIDALEKVKIKMPTEKPMVAMSQLDSDGNFIIQPNPTPDNSNGKVSEERADEIVSQMFGSTSV